MLLTICERCQRAGVYLRRPKWLATPAQLLTGCGGRCRGAVWLRHAARDELLTIAKAWGARAGNTDSMDARLEDGIRLALAQFDHRAAVTAQVRADYPDAHWLERVQRTRQALERERRAQRKRRRDAQRLAIAVAKATHALERSRDRLEGAEYTRGRRHVAQWAPDSVFPNRRLGDVMPRDVARDSAPLIRAMRRAVKVTRLEREDPTCGGFYRDREAPFLPAHVRRAAARAAERIAAARELETLRTVRRRVAGVPSPSLEDL